MKIERLYKLSQFIDHVKHSDNELDGLFSKRQIKKLNLIFKYNDFLKQPLTKEMVVNNESKDWFNKDGSINVKIQLNWMEAEKKVIFEGWQQSNTFKYDVLLGGVTRLDFSNYDFPRLGLSRVTGTLLAKTINDLAEHVFGELKLKNIEI